MFKVAFSIFLCTLSCFTAISQKENIERATEELKSLRQGALIVRLVDRSLTYQELDNRGDSDIAEELREEDRLENLNIIQGFNTHFDFCEVYFIYPDQSLLLAKEQWSEIVFVNDTLVLDESIVFDPETYFLTAEFSLVDFSQVEHKRGQFYHYDDQGNLLVTDDYNRYEFVFPALIIKDHDFVQLERPFPFYVKTLESVAFLKRSKGRVIQKMDENLEYWLSRGFY